MRIGRRTIGSTALILLAGGLLASDSGGRAPDGAPLRQAAPPKSCTTSSCHSGVRRHRFVHGPVAANRCEFCHEPVARATPFEAGPRHQFERTGDDSSPCYVCHEAYGEEAFVHEPVRQGLCLLCHDPHGGEREYLLRLDGDRELCMQCHVETFRHGDPTHGPVRIGACGACHDPHGSPRRFRLRGENDRMCGICHLNDMPTILGASNVHRPVREECGNCHEPHSSPNPFRLISQPPELCLDCHQDIADLIDRSTTVHEPVQQGRCGECHRHHSSEHRRLLQGELTSRLHEPFDVERYDLCYRCHPIEQVTEPVTTTATGFRNGDVNLHYKHVNRSRGGRTCNICHQVHGSNGPKLMNEFAPFGLWQVPIGLERTETGGSCLSGCHQPRGYDRVRPVSNPLVEEAGGR